MPKKRYSAEEIIQRLRGADVLLGQGKTVSQAYEPQPRVDESALSGSIVGLAITVLIEPIIIMRLFMVNRNRRIDGIKQCFHH